MAKTLRLFIAIVITLFGVAVIAAISSRVTSNDYVEYWSSGRLFLHCSNPYSASGVLALEKSQGFLLDAPLIMLNPPWALILVAPLGFCSAFGGLILWILLSAGSIVASILLLEVPPKYRIIAFLFTPVIGTFSMQQSSPFLLLGFSLFLRFNRRSPFFAGVSLFLMAIKPHLFLVFWVVLLVDSIYRRRFTILAGLAAALICVSALVTLISPHVWQDYLALMRGSALDQNFYPTLPTLFRVLIDVKLSWLALVPALLAIVWGMAYFWRNRKAWDWQQHGMPVMLATILTSPYSWISDQLVVLPALTSALSSTRNKWALEILAVINFAALALVSVRSQLCMWIPMAWLAWYLYATYETEPVHSDADALAIE